MAHTLYSGSLFCDTREEWWTSGEMADNDIPLSCASSEGGVVTWHKHERGGDMARTREGWRHGMNMRGVATWHEHERSGDMA
jgi:hypothetical protein